MARCFAITVGLSLLSAFEASVIPFHGVFLKLGFLEWALAVWLPVGAAIYATPAIPKRWWIYFSLLSFIVVFLAVKNGVLYTLWGRRPWMPSSNWQTKFAVLVAYVLLSTALSGILSARIKAAVVDSSADDEEPQREEGPC